MRTRMLIRTLTLNNGAQTLPKNNYNCAKEFTLEIRNRVPGTVTVFRRLHRRRVGLKLVGLMRISVQI